MIGHIGQVQAIGIVSTKMDPYWNWLTASARGLGIGGTPSASSSLQTTGPASLTKPRTRAATTASGYSKMVEHGNAWHAAMGRSGWNILQTLMESMLVLIIVCHRAPTASRISGGTQVILGLQTITV